MPNECNKRSYAKIKSWEFEKQVDQRFHFISFHLCAHSIFFYTLHRIIGMLDPEKESLGMKIVSLFYSNGILKTNHFIQFNFKKKFVF